MLFVDIVIGEFRASTCAQSLGMDCPPTAIGRTKRRVTRSIPAMQRAFSFGEFASGDQQKFGGRSWGKDDSLSSGGESDPTQGPPAL